MMTVSSPSSNREQALTGKSIKELLHSVGNDTSGRREEAVGILLQRDFNSIYRTLEDAIRNDDEADLRNGAMEIMVKFGSRSVAKLLRLLHDENEEVRNFSTVMLGEIKSHKAVEGLIEALSDADPNVRQGAAEALAKIKDSRGVKPVLAMLKQDFFLRFTAVAALGEMRDTRAVPPLLELLHDELLFEPVAEALGNIGDPSALSPLGKLLETAEGPMVAAVARAIVSIQESVENSHRFKNSVIDISARRFISDHGRGKLRSLLQRQNDEKSIAAAIILLGRLKDVDSLPLFFELLKEGDYSFVMEGAVLAIGDKAIPLLDEALKAEDDRVKMLAIRSLRWLGKKTHHAQLYPLLQGQNIELQIEVLQAIERGCDQKLLPRLVAMLKDASGTLADRLVSVVATFSWKTLEEHLLPLVTSAEPRHRLMAVHVFGKINDPIPFSLFSPMLQDPEQTVRGEAFHAAGRRKMKEALPLLLEALHDQHEEVCAEAVAALAEFDDPSFGALLLPLLGKKSEAIRYAAIKALGRLGGRTGGKVLLPFLGMGGRLEYVAIYSIGQLRDPAVLDDLAKCLDHDDADIRRRTVESLSQFRDEKVFPFLEKALFDPHWGVRMAAIQAVAVSGNPRAIKVLSAMLSDVDSLVKSAAVRALGDTRNPAAVPELIGLVTDVEMAGAAFEALLNIGAKGLTRLHNVLLGDHPEEVKEKAVDLLGKIGEPKSREVLLEVLAGEGQLVRLAALDALTHCCDDAAKAKIEAIAAEDEDPEVRQRAQRALKVLARQ